MFFFFLQVVLLKYGLPTRFATPLVLLGWVMAAWSLAWVFRKASVRLEEYARFGLSALLGWASIYCLSDPLLVYSVIWPTLWHRLSGCHFSHRWPLVTAQLLLAVVLSPATPAWLFARASAGVGCLLQLRPGRLARAAGTAALLSGLGPALQLWLFPELDSPWYKELGLAALLLLPQVLLIRTQNSDHGQCRTMSSSSSGRA